MTAIGAIDLQGTGGNWATVGRRSRGGRRVHRQREKRKGVMLNVVSGYAPQVGCELEEKERFWSELDEVMESIPTSERVVSERILMDMLVRGTQVMRREWASLELRKGTLKDRW
ncbi:hypothetical protein QTP86_024400 [Hemibagrus guttatus]|nr:hypothetical protein QTP86_024400 [Hemibagrus guttatus]